MIADPPFVPVPDPATRVQSQVLDPVTGAPHPRDIWVGAGWAAECSPEDVVTAVTAIAEVAFARGYRVHVRDHALVLPALIASVQRHLSGGAQLVVHRAADPPPGRAADYGVRIAGVALVRDESGRDDLGEDAMKHGWFVLSFFVGSGEGMEADYRAACGTPGNTVYVLTGAGGVAAHLPPVRMFGCARPVFVAGTTYARTATRAMDDLEGVGLGL